MSINFALRGDSLDARFSRNGKEAGRNGNNQLAEVTTDKPGINGTTSLDLAGSTFTQHGLIFPGNKNVTDTSRDFSVLVRCQFPAFVAVGNVFCLGCDGEISPLSVFDVSFDASGNLTAYMYDDITSRGINNAGFATGMSVNVWYDLFFTWVNSTKVFSVFKDQTVVSTTTASTNLSANWSSPLMGTIKLGVGWQTSNTEMYVDEMVIWDEIIDPTSVVLTNETDGLDGVLRTGYVDVEEFDGLDIPAGGTSAMSLGSYGF